MRGEVQGYLKARHDVSCAIYDPSPGHCDCQPRKTPLVLQSDFLEVKEERDVLIDVVETLISATIYSHDTRNRIQTSLNKIKLKDR